MFKDMNQQLEEAREKVYRYQKLDQMLIELHKQKTALEKKTEELFQTLEKEEVDVHKLEGKSLSYVLYTVLGNREEKLQKEQQEALAARLKYEQAVQELDFVNKEISNIKSEKSQYRTAEHTYQQLFDQKKSMLLSSGSRTATEILSLTEQVNEEKRMLREVQEAISAGAVVISHLEQALDSLDSAEGWGTWDMLGGGLLSDLAKHGHIDDAKGAVEVSQRALSRFRTELADIRIQSDIHIETDGFAKFADFFFDGLIADWCMQSRINSSQESVTNVRNQVQGVLHKLNQMETQLKNRIEQLGRQINNSIEQAEG